MGKMELEEEPKAGVWTYSFFWNQVPILSSSWTSNSSGQQIHSPGLISTSLWELKQLHFVRNTLVVSPALKFSDSL